jgi:hypothetical protein
MIRTLAISILILFTSCTSNKTQEPHVWDFKSFTIATPPSWEKIVSRGVDSYVGGIKIDSTDGASFDLGLYSNDLSEYVKVNLHDTTFTYMTTSNYPPLNGDSTYMENIKKCKVIWDTIDGYKAKLVIPINSGLGVTGIYIDSLWQINSQNVKFQLSGNNLKPTNEKELLKAFKSLRFHGKTE